MSVPKGLKAFGFTTISKEQKELTVLLEATKYKDDKANKAAEKIRQVEEVKQSAEFTIMLSTLNDVTLNDFNEAEIENVVVNLNDAASMVTSLLDDVVIAVVEPTMKTIKRAYRERPVNWKDIARHYEIYKKVDLTIREYNLLAINGNVSTWTVTFNRWIKDVKSKRDRKQQKRICVIGKALDDELADIVDNYQEHGVPMRNLILRTQLQTLLEVRGRQDILDRMNYFT